MTYPPTEAPRTSDCRKPETAVKVQPPPDSHLHSFKKTKENEVDAKPRRVQRKRTEAKELAVALHRPGGNRLWNAQIWVDGHRRRRIAAKPSASQCGSTRARAISFAETEEGRFEGVMAQRRQRERGRQADPEHEPGTGGVAREHVADGAQRSRIEQVEAVAHRADVGHRARGAGARARVARGSRTRRPAPNAMRERPRVARSARPRGRSPVPARGARSKTCPAPRRGDGSSTAAGGAAPARPV